MNFLRNFFNKNKHDADKGDAVLVTTIISIPLFLVCFSFAAGISMSTWQGTAYKSAAQQAATSSLQKVNSDGYLGVSTMQAFVNNYLSQTGRLSSLTLKDGQKAAGQGAGSRETGVFQNNDVCSSAKINGVERQMPYIEMKLDVDRTLGEDSLFTNPYWSEGTSGTLNYPEYGNGLVQGKQYRVINARVWDASRNVTWFNTSNQQYKDMTCQVYGIDVSAILFGNNEDLMNGNGCAQPTVSPVNPTVVQQANVNNTPLYKSPLSTCSTVTDNLNLDEPVVVTGVYRGWSYVETTGKTQTKGWVQTKNLSPVSTWSISYNLNGGTPDSTLPTSYSWANSRSSITLPNVTRGSDTFAGWQQVSCSTGDPVGDKKLKVPTVISFGSYRDLCFEAIFGLQQVSVSWDFNDGSGVVQKGFYNPGDDVTVPSNPSRSGYVSDGWFTSPTQNVGKVTTSTVKAGTSDVVYYQHYTSVAHPINIDANGGSGGSSNPSTFIMEPYDQKVLLTAPTRPGYDASGANPWSVTSGNASVSGNVLTIPANTNNSVTVKFNWSAYSSNITVDQNGGSGGSVSPDTYKISSNDQSFSLTGATRKGFVFDHWEITQNSLGAVSLLVKNSQGLDELYVPVGAYGPITIKAVWK